MNLLRGWLSPRVGHKGQAPMVRPPMDAPMRDRLLWRLAVGLDLPPSILRAADGFVVHAPTWTTDAHWHVLAYPSPRPEGSWQVQCMEYERTWWETVRPDRFPHPEVREHH